MAYASTIVMVGETILLTIEGGIESLPSND